MDRAYTGLTSSEAAKLLVTHGKNVIEEKKSENLLAKLFSQFTSLLVVLLILAAIASIALGDVVDGIFILLIVFLNGILGFVQEFKAEKAIEALKSMTVSTVRVMRDGNEERIESTQLVPGDIIILEEGDKVPADARVVEGIHLEVNEASLTGESLAIEKRANVAGEDEIYLGTIITRGRCKATVFATGSFTKFGQIAKTLATMQDEQTPLQKKLTTLGKQLSFLAIGTSGIVMIFGYFKGFEFFEMLLTSISLAVAAVPEGLPAVITITLAVGMQRMARKRAILRKLSSIEALGATTMIATDKTGTLTKNQMTVTQIWTDHNHFDTTNLAHNASLEALIETGIVCNNASIMLKDNGAQDILGDSTEGALLLLAQQRGIDIQNVRSLHTLVEEYAFDPNIKMMSVVTNKNGSQTIHTKGAPEMVLTKCTKYFRNGQSIPLSDSLKSEILSVNATMASKGLRVIALAHATMSHAPLSREGDENNLTFLGYVGISDPPREEVAHAIHLAREAGIETIMITGDNPLTAQAIARSIGLIKDDEMVITGQELSKMSNENILSILPNTRVFARISPDQKLLIVRLLKKLGHTIAVTGDGVNDALAIKQADVGVSMGITGTDVAKEASDMILTDDNYATLVTAVEEGRTIFDNIKSAIKYLVGCNVGEVVAVLAGLILGWPLILTPLQLLYINLVTDGLPAIALAITPKHKNIMRRKPLKNGHLFEKRDVLWLAEVSTITAVTTLVAFAVGEKIGGTTLARSFSFTTIILVQQFILTDIWLRDESLLNRKIFKNIPLLIAFFGPIVFQPFILFIPLLTGLFKVQQVTIIQLLFVVLISATMIFTSEIRKLTLKTMRSKQVVR